MSILSAPTPPAVAGRESGVSGKANAQAETVALAGPGTGVSGKALRWLGRSSISAVMQLTSPPLAVGSSQSAPPLVTCAAMSASTSEAPGADARILRGPSAPSAVLWTRPVSSLGLLVILALTAVDRKRLVGVLQFFVHLYFVWC